MVLGQELTELLFEQQQVLGAGTHDGVDLVAGLHQVTGDRVGNGQADAAADDRAGAVRHLGGDAQRAGDVLDGVTLLVGGQHLRGLADHHEDELDPALLGVPARERERDALARLVGAHHQELAGVSVLGHPGRLDAELEHLLRELRLFEDLVH